MLSFFLSLGALLGAPPAPSASAQDLDLEKEIRTSVRWLRSVQDPVQGRYGEGAEATALALRAFAECPDRYRVHDGPFVRRAAELLTSWQRADGSICDPGADQEACQRTTRLAAQAFLALGDPSLAQPLGKALSHLGVSDPTAAGWDEPAPEGSAGALAAAREILGQRNPVGFWEGPRGRVIETSQAVLRLSSAHRSIAKARGSPPAKAAQKLPEFAPEGRAAALAAIERGARFLAAAADEKGRFGQPGKPDAGITAMALAGLQTWPAPRPEEIQKKIDVGLAWLLSLQKEDGSIHDGKLANYCTSAAILALARAARSEHAPAILRARAFLQELQVDEGEGYSEGDVYYGGIGYGSTERPDLSNLQMALEALSASGLSKDDATYEKALRYLQRCQNRSESNDTRLAEGQVVIGSGNDGGAGYAPGDSKAGLETLADGTRVPRSYGSMTYALLKCYVFAGLPKEDPRLAAAWEWCQRNYTLDVNPGFQASADPTAAYQGLFYYFATMARALEAFGADEIAGPGGARHAWRAELCGRLAAMQSKLDGSWVNPNSSRWLEGNPLLATSYALLALDAALP